MPLEVRELNIKVKVGNDATTDGAADGGDEADKIQEIVEKVLEALEKQAER